MSLDKHLEILMLTGHRQRILTLNKAQCRTSKIDDAYINLSECHSLHAPSPIIINTAREYALNNVVD